MQREREREGDENEEITHQKEKNILEGSKTELAECLDILRRYLAIWPRM